jgi:hypothetical protein
MKPSPIAPRMLGAFSLDSSVKSLYGQFLIKRLLTL